MQLLARKRSKTLSEVRLVENINKSLQSFLEISPVQKEVLFSHKLQDHAHEKYNLFRLNEDNPSQRNCQYQLSRRSLLHIESLIQGKIYIRQNWNEGPCKAKF